MKIKKISITFLLIIFVSMQLFAQQKPERSNETQVDTRIDNMTYWKEKAAQGLVPYNPKVEIPQAIIKGSNIRAFGVRTDDSPDTPVNEETNNTQSENSVFIDPNDSTFVINSNNSNSWNGLTTEYLWGTSYYFSNNLGEEWDGELQTIEPNYGDPTSAINLDGRLFLGFIDLNYGQAVKYSDNGNTWTSVQAVENDGMLCDKNHLWIDNSLSSPYVGNLYNAWTDIEGDNDANIEFVYSNDNGLSYSSPINISSAVNAGSHNQGVNIQTGNDGEVYAVWTIYDSWPADETALGFAKSTDGGQTFDNATRIIENIRGVRNSGTIANMRANSFPVMAVDISGGTYNENIYIVWTNRGEPGVNAGSNISVYMIKSDNQGNTWSEPIRVNQGAFESNMQSWLPWITCDPVTGVLSCIFYDNRNTEINMAETWVSNSYDGGETWEDFKISDVAFTPSPIAGLSADYMGDYLGIAARGGYVYPVWTDNRDGRATSYCSPFTTNLRARPENLEIELSQSNGQSSLTWDFSETKTLNYFKIYRNGEEIGTTTDNFHVDFLPDYGEYKYFVTAMHNDGESARALAPEVIWGSAIISLNPSFLTETLAQDQTSIKQISITNSGQLNLEYNISSVMISKTGEKEYCMAAGGGSTSHISRVAFGDIDNHSGQTYYGDYTNLSTNVSAGNTYPITVENGDPFSGDDLTIWIDFNQDGDFEDAGEELVCAYACSGQGTYDLTIPDDVLAGQTTMRIRNQYYIGCQPCGISTYGEVEDYTVNITNWLSFEAQTGTVAPGNTEIVNVTFSSYDLEVGQYSANISISTNDAENSLLEIPVILQVEGESELAVNPVAIPQYGCTGGIRNIYSNVTGGTGSYTYDWTSNPEGYTSSNDNALIFGISETTTYIVEVDDGNNIITKQITVYVRNEMDIPETPTGSITIGNDNNNTIYLTQGTEYATSYEWQLLPEEAGTIAGSSVAGIVNWNNDFIGTAYISVRGVNECITGDYSDEIEIEVIDGTTLTKELNSEIAWNLYPNPNAGKFILEFNSEITNTININIYDMLGKIVYSDLGIKIWEYNSKLIDLGNSGSGVYFIHITGENINETKKIIIRN